MGNKITQLDNLSQLIATKPIRVFILKSSMNLPLEKTNIGKIPEDRRENLSWKGCYYTINLDESFFYIDSNYFDLCHFKLNNGLTFEIQRGNPLNWVLENEVIIKGRL